MEMYNVPWPEVNRSPAAQVVAKLAVDSGLFLTHFEHRHHLPLPSMWLPEDRPDLAGSLEWRGGVLKENKFLHFRYDQPLGSLHPSHRAKWTAHELCHGLVGFAWRPDMSPLAHCLTARLAEVLPVALWYFFDEVQLRRCPLHYLQGALFQDHCVYCERLAEQGPRLPELEDEAMIKEGIKFVKDELAMIAKSKRFGRPLPHRYATLDLNSDSMAYVAQNLKRMEDPYFRMFVELFHGQHTGMCSDLDELEGRVWGLTEALSGGLPANPLPIGKDHWIAQDLGWRLLSVAAQCEDREAIDHLESLAEGLARSPQALGPVFRGYQELYDTFFLPAPEEMFALGYPLIDPESETVWGSDLAQLYRGIDSACPSLSKALGAESLSEQVSAFAVWDLERPQRVGIGKRFAQFLAETARGPLSDLASYEATLQHPESPDPYSAAFAWHSAEGNLTRRAQGVDVLNLRVEVSTLIEAIENEDEDMEVPEREHWMLICNQAGGVRRVVEISERSANALELLSEGPVERPLLNLDEEEWDVLIDAGAITPCNWHIYTPEVLNTSSAQFDSDGLLPDAFALTSSRGMWSQARPAHEQNTVAEGIEAFEPTPIYEVESEQAFSNAPEPIMPEDLSAEAQATKSLQELSAVIEGVRSGMSIDSARSRPLQRKRSRPKWGEAAFAPTPQITSAQALEAMGYSEERPPENKFEERLRDALAKQKQNELSSPADGHPETMTPLLADMDLNEEELFSFDLEDSIEELLQEEAEFMRELGEVFGDRHETQTEENPSVPKEPEVEQDLSGKDVGFGERWGDWEEQ